MTIIAALLNFLFPQDCLNCGVPLQSRDKGCLCLNCAALLKIYAGVMCPRCGRPTEGCGAEGCGAEGCGLCGGQEFHTDTVGWFFEYHPLVRALIHRHKYGKDRAVIELLERAFSAAPQLHSPAPFYHFIVPVPLHRKKLKKRGFNQAEDFGKMLAKQRGKNERVHTKLLVRIRATEAQNKLDRNERLKNLEGAFGLHPKFPAAQLKGAIIVLVDDILTTGSTINECAKVLKTAGAARVDALTLSRAI